MKPLLKLRHTIIGGVLLLAAIGSSALTLGRPRGAVIIGQSLNVVIPVRTDSGEDAATQCYEADVFHADTRVDGSRISVTVEPGAMAQEFNVRVRSATVIDEPVISIYLRAGCLQRTTRRYVLLADVAAEVIAPLTLPSITRQPDANAVRVPSTPAAAVPGATAGAGTSTPAQARAAARIRAREAAANDAAPTAPTRAAAERAAAAGNAASPTAAAASKPARPAAAPAPAPVRESVVRRKNEGSKSRLKLDPLDLLVEVDPVLRSSSELITPPSDNPQVRAEAAALWRALNAQPLDILRDAQRLQGLEADVKALRDVTSKNQASLSELNVRLQKAEGERYANGLVYALAALVLAALGLAGFFWWRTRGTDATGDVWWRGRGRDFEADEDPRERMAPAAAPVKPLTEVDVDLGMDENLFASLKSRTVAQPATTPPPRFVRAMSEHSDFASSLPGMSRAVNAEELFDIQQQADFFVSLGQHDQAIEVLKNHISDNVETSALAYLDLLKIYHSLDRREEYDVLRDDFNRVFNAQVPLFDSYSDDSNGLESYHTAMSRIEALWPSAKVLEIIEESIFRKPGTGDGEAFDLEAYRELLLLYAMAKDVVDRHADYAEYELSGPSSIPADSDGGSQFGRTSKFSATNIQPLSAAQYPDPGAGEPLPDIPLPKPSPRLGLDIDLDEPGPLAAYAQDHQKTDFDLGDFHSESTVEDVDSMGASRMDEPSRPATADSHLIDFDLFDAATEAEITPKPIKPFKR
jgi:pilus assembly protein FimV